MWGQLSTTCSNVLKQPNGELLVAVNHKQLRTMASETVDPIGWSHPPPSWTPERHVHSINQCNPSGTRTCNRSMRCNHLAFAATQGISTIWKSKTMRNACKLFWYFNTFRFAYNKISDAAIIFAFIYIYLYIFHNWDILEERNNCKYALVVPR